MDGTPFLTYNGSLIGGFCDTSPPLIGDHAALGEKMSRPCSPGIESYVSKGRGLRAKNGREIHLDIPGVLMPQNSASQTAPACATRSRLVVRTAGEIFIICPVPSEHTVKLSSSRANWTSHIKTDLISVSVQLAGQSTG